MGTTSTRLNTDFYLGIDFGTSGARAIAIDAERTPQASVSVQFKEASAQDWSEQWKAALFHLLEQLPLSLRRQIRSIAINGTSSTVLIVDAFGQPLQPPLLYNDDRGQAVLEQVRAIAPSDHSVVSATSSLTKLMWWVEQGKIGREKEVDKGEIFFLHQADWLAFLLHGRLGVSDYHNALKLGYDVEALCYPDWLRQVPLPLTLPTVLAPGTPIAPVTESVSTPFGLPSDCWVCAGTTDSIAAFLASGASSPGEAVTSLGSTIVLKLLSRTRVDQTRYGIYSHRFGDLWLVGGASNTGGAVLKQFFNEAELRALSARIAGDRPSPLDYYPLLKPGERFPVNDPQLPPRIDPRPADSVAFLHGLLESMARIEAEGYRLLQQFGATPVTCVLTAGGGAQNPAWTQIRSRHLQVPVMAATHTEAAYGTALLAMQGGLSVIRR